MGRIGLMATSDAVPILGERFDFSSPSGRRLLITKCDRTGTRHLPSLFRHGAYLLQHGSSHRGMLPGG
jgi:hypothetical protein